MLLDNIAVDPVSQGTGLGRQLLIFAEAEAMRLGYSNIRLYTHKTMVENRRLYARIGYAETARGVEAGSGRVSMCKQLRAV
jgi:ribosomal protein S18 acetylase RimI-like enzyme